MALAEKVVWTIEKECFETFIAETAKFYAIHPGTDDDNDSLSPVSKQNFIKVFSVLSIVCSTLILTDQLNL